MDNTELIFKTLKEADQPLKAGEIVEKTGLISLAGTFQQIDRGHIAKGSKVLCCLTSGMSTTDGRLEPTYAISGTANLENEIAHYSRLVREC